MSRILGSVSLALLLLIAAGCGSPNPAVISVDENDTAMNEAIAEAKQTFGFFIEHWQTMESDSAAFKVHVKVDDGAEHIWFTPVSVNQDQLVGICANEPIDIAGLKMGDQRTFSCDDLSDWMILDGDQCHGGYTIEVMSQLSPQDAPPFEFVRADK
ncbi:MAG: DUF2314 domain-containing protein [Fuerstiella sp.]